MVLFCPNSVSSAEPAPTAATRRRRARAARRASALVSTNSGGRRAPRRAAARGAPSRRAARRRNRSAPRQVTRVAPDRRRRAIATAAVTPAPAWATPRHSTTNESPSTYQPPVQGWSWGRLELRVRLRKPLIVSVRLWPILMRPPSIMCSRFYIFFLFVS